MKKKLFKFVLIILVVLSMFINSSCRQKIDTGSPTSAEDERGDKLEVVTTFFPVYDCARQIGGDEVIVRNLLPPGGSPHTFEPTTTDSRAIEKADLIFKLGLELDDWMDTIIKSTGTDSNVIELSRGIETIPLGSSPVHSHSDDKSKSFGQDPHIWMDPLKMKEMAKNARDAYIEKVPEKKEIFQKNYQIFAQKLDQLDKKYTEALSELEHKRFVTFHPFMNYLARRYDLEPVAVVTEFPGKQPDPHHLIEVIKKLREKNVRVVFVEPQFSPDASQIIANEIGGKVVVIDPLGSLSNPQKDTYVENMEQNLKNLVKAFEESENSRELPKKRQNN